MRDSQRFSYDSEASALSNSVNVPGTYTLKLESLLERLRQGDEDARSQIIAHACERLRQLTHRMLAGYEQVRFREQTDDVLNAALMRLDKALRSVQPNSATHFFRLAALQIRRQLIDLTRRCRSLNVTLPPNRLSEIETTRTKLAPVAGLKTETWNPSNVAEWHEFHLQVEQLPEKERETFELLWYQGLTQEEAAKILGVSRRTIIRRWRAACVLLYQKLNGYLPEKKDGKGCSTDS